MFTTVSNKFRCFWLVVQRCFFVLVVCGIGYYALAINDQGQDLILSLGENEITSRYFWLLQAGIIIWSIGNWYNSRVLLTLSDFTAYEVHGIEGWIRYVPRAFGVIPFVVVFLAVVKLETHLHPVPFWIFVTVVLVESVVMVILFSQRRKLANKLGMQTLANPYSAVATAWSTLMAIKSFGVFFRSLVVAYIVVVILFLLPVEYRIAHWFMPGTIMLLGLTALTTFLSVLSYFNNWKTNPVFIYLIIWVALCSLFNDNSTLRLIKNAKKDHRPSIHDQFKQWVAHHAPNTGNTNRPKTIPLIIIATQGGGIRAMYWNNMLMARLDTLYPKFTEHVFAISGVSGGGVGASLYLSYYRDFVLNNKRFSKKLDAFSSADYLSSVSAAFLFSDNIQKLSPLAWPALDRTRWLENAWALGYCDQTQLHTLDSAFLSLWNLPEDRKYKLPSLFLNGTLAETGQKTIVSNLALDDHFFDVVDIEDSLGKDDVPVKTAASLCSRFPVITSGGLLFNKDHRAVGHVVDGGYAENTGIETALSIYASLREPIREHNRTSTFRIQPLILFIKNSKETDEDKVITWFIDIKTPLNAFIKSWDRRAPVGNHLASDILNDPTKDSLYFTLTLDRNNARNVNLPLGWFLSGDARKTILEQAQNVDSVGHEGLWKKLEGL